MNFQYLRPIEKVDCILDLAFKKAREKKLKSNKKRIPLVDFTKKKFLLKTNLVGKYLVNYLRRILNGFPSLEKLPLFYLELIKITLDYSLLKKSLGAVNWAIKRIDSLSQQYSQLFKKSNDLKKIKKLKKEYYGRISSILKGIKKELDYLEYARKVMKGYPDIKEMFTVCIFGFPNVGKTTLLNKLTGAKAEINVYPFTTKRINLGYITTDNQKIQLLDVPGTLARLEKMNNLEKQGYLAIKYLADLIIYVFDLTEPYPLEKQEKLFLKLKKETSKPVLIYLSKTDLLEEKQTSNFRKKHSFLSLNQLKEKFVCRAKNFKIPSFVGPYHV